MKTVEAQVCIIFFLHYRNSRINRTCVCLLQTAIGNQCLYHRITIAIEKNGLSLAGEGMATSTFESDKHILQQSKLSYYLFSTIAA